jgi:hypothetical protein
MQEGKNKIYISTLVIFWLIFAFFILNLLSMFAMPLFGPYIQFVSIPLMVILPIIGIALIVLVSRVKFQKIAKAFFILTGSSAIGITVFGVLHNLLFALLIKLFGEDFGARIGDEPVFFILATIVCPIALLVGIIGSIVLIAKKKVIAY